MGLPSAQVLPLIMSNSGWVLQAVVRGSGALSAEEFCSVDVFRSAYYLAGFPAVSSSPVSPPTSTPTSSISVTTSPSLRCKRTFKSMSFNSTLLSSIEHSLTCFVYCFVTDFNWFIVDYLFQLFLVVISSEANIQNYFKLINFNLLSLAYRDICANPICRRLINHLSFL